MIFHDLHVNPGNPVNHVKTDLGPNTIEHPGKRYRLSNMLDAAHPRGASFNTHAESGVRDAAITAQVQIPLKCFLW